MTTVGEQSAQAIEATIGDGTQVLAAQARREAARIAREFKPAETVCECGGVGSGCRCEKEAVPVPDETGLREAITATLREHRLKGPRFRPEGSPGLSHPYPYANGDWQCACGARGNDGFANHVRHIANALMPVLAAHPAPQTVSTCHKPNCPVHTVPVVTVTDAMVERAAKAAFYALRNVKPHFQWDEATEATRQMWRNEARAALSAALTEDGAE